MKTGDGMERSDLPDPSTVPIDLTNVQLFPPMPGMLHIIPVSVSPMQLLDKNLGVVVMIVDSTLYKNYWGLDLQAYKAYLCQPSELFASAYKKAVIQFLKKSVAKKTKFKNVIFKRITFKECEQDVINDDKAPKTFDMRGYIEAVL